MDRIEGDIISSDLLRVTGRKRIAVYAGSFDPFTVGHAHIVARAMALFDEVHIVIAVNYQKKPFRPLEERTEQIRALYADDPQVRVVCHEGIVAKYARSLGEQVVLLRGIRTVTDMEAERVTADVNRHHFGVDTLFLFADAEYSSISSTMVRELAAFGEDYSAYVPQKEQLH